MTNDSSNEKLERLISRFLDEEASATDRRVLNATLDRDPAARALYEETAALDREVGRAMRSAVGRTFAFRPAARRFAWSRLIGVAAAAALAAVLVFKNTSSLTGVSRDGLPVQHAGAWGFLPAEQPGDTYDAARPNYALPHVQMRDTQRDWLVVPAERPGQLLIIEVQRVQTRAVGIHKDY